MNKLRNNGIETMPFFWPLHVQPALPDEYKTTRKLLVSERLGSNGLYLPMGKHVNKNSQNKISETLLKKARSSKN